MKFRSRGEPQLILTKYVILKFIKTNGSVSYDELASYFNCRELRAKQRLTELKKQGLVENRPRGHWNLTYDGERRLAYYERRKNRQEENQAAGT